MPASRVEGYRSQFKTVQNMLEGTVDGMTIEQFNFQPGGTATSPGANYLHHVQGMDAMVLGRLKGGTPLIESTFQSSVGKYAQPHDSAWNSWGAESTFDVDASRAYGKAVYQGVDDWLASLADADLDAPVDLSSWGRGEQPASFLLDLYVIDGAAHSGEISFCKGIQGLKGYPF